LTLPPAAISWSKKYLATGRERFVSKARIAPAWMIFRDVSWAKLMMTE
jgi:hypothetical protein